MQGGCWLPVLSHKQDYEGSIPSPATKFVDIEERIVWIERKTSKT